MPTKPFRTEFNRAAHARYMRAVENDLQTPAKIVKSGMYRLVKGVWITQSEFIKNNPIPTVTSFLLKTNQADGRRKYLVE